MMGLGIQEVVVVGIIFILLFGGKKFAELGKGLGSGITNFKKGLAGKFKDEDEKDGDKAA